MKFNEFQISKDFLETLVFGQFKILKIGRFENYFF